MSISTPPDGNCLPDRTCFSEPKVEKASPEKLLEEKLLEGEADASSKEEPLQDFVSEPLGADERTLERQEELALEKESFREKKAEEPSLEPRLEETIPEEKTVDGAHAEEKYPEERVTEPSFEPLQDGVPSDTSVDATIPGPPTISPTPSLPRLGFVCAQDADCGTGLVCVAHQGSPSRCHQDCRTSPLDCAKNTDGRTLCFSNDKGQRYCTNMHAQEGQQCGFGMQASCELAGRVPLFCHPQTWTCEKVQQTGGMGEACDIEAGKGCLPKLTCTFDRTLKNPRCLALCRAEYPAKECQAFGLEDCGRHLSGYPLHCGGEGAGEGEACGGISPVYCKSWLSLYCDATTKTCKKAPATAKSGEACTPSASGVGCLAGLFCVGGRCVENCQTTPSLCAKGERCEADAKGLWGCRSALAGEACDPQKTTCVGAFACDAQSQTCALPPAPTGAVLGGACASSPTKHVQGLVCLDVYDSFRGTAGGERWLQDCSQDRTICSKNTDGRTTCYPLARYATGFIEPRWACLRIDAKEGEACGSAAQARCEDTSSSRLAALRCVQGLCQRLSIQTKEGDPCDGPSLDNSAQRLCDRDAMVPLVCDNITKSCVKADVVQKGDACLGGSKAVCAVGLICLPTIYAWSYDEAGTCQVACDLKSPQCPQGSTCKLPNLITLKVHQSYCYED
ncbi:MAG: hypothetical protein H6728_06460 [Myxococcales bacterium]|nr:hypothetical protein [Myxococcales bacterium]